ncbi:MAG: hypothetical protein KBA53_11795 [Thermoclostridium sp.]|nr:hypothetical protein [Thermoclostridium sp.]
MKIHELTCPQCGSIQEVEIRDSLNVTSEPELRRRLFNADINIFTCESCDHKAIISVPLLYLDMNRQYCVQYYPPESIEDDNFLAQFTPDGKWNFRDIPEIVNNDLDYMGNPHFVFSLSDMMQYIKFRDRLYEKAEQKNK